MTRFEQFGFVLSRCTRCGHPQRLVVWYSGPVAECENPLCGRIEEMPDRYCGWTVGSRRTEDYCTPDQ
mgnify:CR=1 FL=1